TGACASSAASQPASDGEAHSPWLVVVLAVPALAGWSVPCLPRRDQSDSTDSKMGSLFSSSRLAGGGTMPPVGSAWLASAPNLGATWLASAPNLGATWLASAPNLGATWLASAPNVGAVRPLRERSRPGASSLPASAPKAGVWPG